MGAKADRIMERGTNRRWYRSRLWSILLIVVLVAESGLVVGLFMKHVAERHALNSISFNQGVAGALQIASETSQVGENIKDYDNYIDNMSDKLLNKGLSSKQEYAADRIGTELAYFTGYERNGLVSFLEILRKNTKSKQKIFSTHPSLSGFWKEEAYPADQRNLGDLFRM